MLLVANSFELWQKDAFFSAAEEIQQSADVMESAYRTWQRMKKIEYLSVEHLNTFCRDLQTALGTTKWQLNQLERAVSSSYINRIDDTSNMSRHTQFIDAIKIQIFKVETELRDGKTPLRWVNLDEDDRDDLAAFLSGSLTTSHIKKDGHCRSSSSGSSNSSYSKVHHPEGILIDVVENSLNSSYWKLDIVVDDDHDDDEIKDKERRINCLNQIIGPRLHRQLQTPLNFQFPSSRLMFWLLLIVFLMVPFLLFST
ncbi:uncharacterized protein LOC124915726 [Impatiens glandulifera]|uniref:uncharacterized protein LOC124915726 n=1 Tax=Impatiens glandulifera TaxID=253017 RepID=UPI001FB06CC9|nr:uncharacterized protein LOC124915726 [Impatiens glandulifera]